MKKKITIGKKLTFNKTAIAYLNESQQAKVAGGMPPITKQLTCDGPTRQISCETVPDAGEPCIVC